MTTIELTYGLLVLGYLIAIVVIGYCLLSWLEFRIRRRIKLTTSVLSDKDQKLVKQLKYARSKLLLSFLCMIVGLTLGIMAAYHQH